MESLARKIAARFARFGIRKKGRPMLKKLQLACTNVEAAQQNVLQDIMHYAARTEYGLEHNFSSIRTPADFETAVPVNTYEDLRPLVERHENGESNILFPGRPMFYATTSGTTSAPKRIPITQKYHDECYNGLSNLWLHNMFDDCPGFMNGYDISMVGKAIEGYTGDGTSFGSFSGHMNAYLPEFVKRFRVVPFDVHDIDDYPSKYYTLLRVALTYPIRWIVAANPSSLLELHRGVVANLDDLIKDIHDGTLKDDLNIVPVIRQKVEQRLKPDKKRAQELDSLRNEHIDTLLPKHYWPTLQVINTWKSGNAAVYLKQTEHYYPPHTIIREFGYLATEARAGIVLHNAQETSILAAHLLYFEFVDREDLGTAHPTFLGTHQLKRGREYAIYITTPSGLYRYNMNDIVRVEDFYGTFPMVRFVQKGSGVTSLTGEKLYESQYLQAVNQGLQKSRISAGFHMAFADIASSQYHCFIESYISGEETKPTLDGLAVNIDEALQTINPEYAAKRKSNRLRPLQVHQLPSNAFACYKQQRIKEGQREGQFKLTHLQQNNDQMALFFSLCHDYSFSSGGNIWKP